jgi:hypothetical protein
VYNIDDYKKMSKEQKNWFNKIVNSEPSDDLDEIYFLLEIKLSDIENLKKMLKYYIDKEDYVKCSYIKKILDNK